MMFFYHYDSAEDRAWRDEEDMENVTVPWLVIQKQWVQKLDGGYYEYLCVGPGPTLDWKSVANRWIIRVADPGFPDFVRP